jgi:phosphohistidine phosphatase
MDLILWRHAEAEDGADDMRRALTKLGHAQASQVGAWLDAHLPGDARILVSPARRAQETARALGRAFDTVEALAPGADAVDVAQACGWPETKGSVLVVGHQPTLGRLTSMLLFGIEQEFTLKKAGLVWLTNRVRRDERRVVLKAALYPGLLP